MKVAFIPLILISILTSLNCQNSSVSAVDILSKKINRLQELKYGSTNLPKECYQFEINLEDSILIFRSPITVRDGDKPSIIDIRMMPIKNLHPKSSWAFKYEDECILRIVPRVPIQYEEGFLGYLLRIEDFLQYGEAPINQSLIKPTSKGNNLLIDSKDCKLLKDISVSFEKFIQEVNLNIPKNEKFPNPRVLRLGDKDLRRQAGNLISNLEKSDPNRLVLPTYNVELDNPPLYGTGETLENSIGSFESNIIDLAKANKIKVQKNISGDLVIDEEGNIIEVLMANVNTPEFEVEIAPNEAMKKLILASGKWIPAKHRGKRIAVKVRFYLRKGRINGN